MMAQMLGSRLPMEQTQMEFQAYGLLQLLWKILSFCLACSRCHSHYTDQRETAKQNTYLPPFLFRLMTATPVRAKPRCFFLMVSLLFS